MEKALIYRNAQVEDLPAIVAIYNSTVAGRMVTADTEPVQVADRMDWLKSHNVRRRPLWVAECDGETVGWISFKDFYGRPAYSATAEISIYLAPGARGMGLGKKILAYSMQQAAVLGIKNVLGFIFSHNTPSIRLFEQAGFTQWGMLPEVAEMDGNKYSLIIMGNKLA